MPSTEIRPLLPPGKAHLIPVEILSEIFSLVLRDRPKHKRGLVLVCQRWRDIMLSMPSITSRLWIRRATKKEAVQAFIQGRRTRLTVVVDVNSKIHGRRFNADDFHASLMVAIQAASRWRALDLLSVPPPGRDNESHTIVQPLDVLLQPSCLHVFCSLTRLTVILSKMMESPADILPHLQVLRRFKAQHLHLPVYSRDACLPLIQTLHHLTLKSVSIQWMAGKAFPVLRNCSIEFPHHIATICLQPVAMPACTFLKYDSNDLHPLAYFHDLPLAKLVVTCGQWNARRGNPQLVAMCSIIFSSAQSLSTLDLQVQCSEQLLVLALSHLPALDELTLRIARPHALSEAFFQAFIATNSNADSPCVTDALPRTPLCVNLTRLEVHYKRWLRGPERNALIPVFGGISFSRNSGAFVLVLSIERPESSWLVWWPVESMQDLGFDLSAIGISSPHGIIPIEMEVERGPFMEVPFQDAEYLWADQDQHLSIDLLSTLHHLMELRIFDEGGILPNNPPPDLPLFHTLRVFEAKIIHPSFLAGRTFDMLQRCRISNSSEDPKLSEGQVTQMPVCTTLDVGDLTLLATFKLPQIRKLGVSFDHAAFKLAWEKHITMNANLSGLKLLHVYAWYRQADLIQVLRCLPALKSLILGGGSDLDAGFFGEFVPMSQNTNGTSALGQSYDEGPISTILCPLLRQFLVEDFDSTEQLELIPVLKDIVTLRSVAGSPLKKFALFDFLLGRKFKLIWSDGGVLVKKISLSWETQPFHLAI